MIWLDYRATRRVIDAEIVGENSVLVLNVAHTGVDQSQLIRAPTKHESDNQGGHNTPTFLESTPGLTALVCSSPPM